jgi:hypothetical protein
MLDVFEQIDALLGELRRSNRKAKAISIGQDMKAAFESQAGAAYVRGCYFGIPVSFDAVEPTTVTVEPA